jgi:hypothetical protein
MGSKDSLDLPGQTSPPTAVRPSRSTCPDRSGSHLKGANRVATYPRQPHSCEELMLPSAGADER